MSRRGLSFLLRCGQVGISACFVFWISCIHVAKADEPATSAPATAAPVSVEQLLPARTIFLWQDDGFQAHAAAYAKTAASDALSATGVYDSIAKLVNSFVKSTADGDDLSQEFIASHLQHVIGHGFSVAVSLPDGKIPGYPRLMIVLHEGGHLTKLWEQAIEVEREKQAKNAEAAAKSKNDKDNQDQEDKPDADEDDQPAKAPSTPTEWTSRRIGPRTVWSSKLKVNGEPFEACDFAIWTEGPHLVFVCGFNAIDSTIAIANGDSPNITTHRLWKELHREGRKFARRSLGWVDVATVREVVDDLPLPLEGFGPNIEDMLSPLLGMVPVVSDSDVPSIDAQPVVSNEAGHSIISVRSVRSDEPAATSPAAVPRAPVVVATPVIALNTPATSPPASVAQPPFPTQPPVGEVSPSLESPLPLISVIEDEAAYPSDLPPISVSEDDVNLPEAPRTKKRASASRPTIAAVDPDEKSPPVEVAAEATTVKQIVTAIGLDSVQDWTWQSGYRGRAQWSESALHTAGPRRGLLGLASTKTMTIDDLPPLPANIGSFVASTTDLRSMGDAALYLLKNAAPLLVTVVDGDIDEALGELPQQFDLIIINDIVTSLDSVVCTYNDGANGPLTFGPVLAWKVKDGQKLRAAVNRLLELAAKPTVIPAVSISVPTSKSVGSITPASANQKHDEFHIVPGSATEAQAPRRVPTKSKRSAKSRGNSRSESGYYQTSDDVQYFPADPEFRLQSQIEALEAYKKAQAQEKSEESSPTKSNVSVGTDGDKTGNSNNDESDKPTNDCLTNDDGETDADDAKPMAADDVTDGDESATTPFQVSRKIKYGRELVTLKSFMGVTFTIDDQWLVVSLNPQLVEAFLLRLDGKLPRWQPSDAHREALQDLPAKFTSITVDDPRQTLPYLLSLIPAGLSLLDQIGLSESDDDSDPAEQASVFSLADFPPAELIVQPLFPNVTVVVSDEQGTRNYSRTSLRSVSLWDCWPILMYGSLIGLDEISPLAFFE